MSGFNNTQATKKSLHSARRQGQQEAKKKQEQRKVEKGKSTRKHINDKANFTVGGEGNKLDRINIRKQLQQLDRQRALEKLNGENKNDEKKNDEKKSDKKDVKKDEKKTNPTQKSDSNSTTKSTTSKSTSTTTRALPYYYQSGKTLILGDGDFSFTASLLHSYRGNVDPQNITTTTYDTLNQVKYKYSDTYNKYLTGIHATPAIVINGIDATKLSDSFPNPFTTNQYPPGIVPSPLQSVIKIQYPFDRILFNFPHTGEQRVHINRALLADFFISARPHLSLPSELSYPVGNNPTAIAQRDLMDELLEDVKGKLLPKIVEIRKKYLPLTQNINQKFDKANPKGLEIDPFGRVLVVLRDGDPYDGWEIDVQAANGLFQLESKILWEPSWWKFYQHKTTDISHNALEGGKAHIYVFKLTNVGVAMALQEIQTQIYPLQDARNKAYFTNMDGKMAECMNYTSNNAVLTDPTKVDGKFHIGPFQNKSIIKHQNKLKQRDEQANMIKRGQSDGDLMANGKKRKDMEKDDEDDVKIDGIKLTQTQQDAMITRLNAVANDNNDVVNKKKATKKKKGDDVIEQVSKKQKTSIDTVMSGVSNAEKSKSLLNQLVQLDGGDSISSDIKLDEKTTKKNKKDKKEAIKNDSPATSPANSIFGSFSLDALLALEADIAPEVTQKRLADEKMAKEKAELAEKQRLEAIAVKEAQRIAQEQARIEAKRQKDEENAKLFELKAKKNTQMVDESDDDDDGDDENFDDDSDYDDISDDGAADDIDDNDDFGIDLKKYTQGAANALNNNSKGKNDSKNNKKEQNNSSKNDVWDFSKSDDIGLSKEIFAMLTGIRGVADDTDDDSDYGASSGSDDDGDSGRGRSKQAQKGKKVENKRQIIQKDTKSSATSEKINPKQNTKQSIPVSAPVSGFSGFGTGGVGKKDITTKNTGDKKASNLTNASTTSFSGFGTGGVGKNVTKKSDKKIEQVETTEKKTRVGNEKVAKKSAPVAPATEMFDYFDSVPKKPLKKSVKKL